MAFEVETMVFTVGALRMIYFMYNNIYMLLSYIGRNRTTTECGVHCLCTTTKRFTELYFLFDQYVMPVVYIGGSGEIYTTHGVSTLRTENVVISTGV